MLGSTTFIGGMRWPAGARTFGGNATWPFVRLTLDGNGIHLSPNGLFAWIVSRVALMPSYDIPWADLQRVERLPRGVRFVTASLEAPAIFWAHQPERVLDALAAYGVVVDRQASPWHERPRLARPQLTRRTAVALGLDFVATLVINIMWSVVGIPLSLATPLRVVSLIMSIAYAVAVVLLPANFWTRGR